MLLLSIVAEGGPATAVAEIGTKITLIAQVSPALDFLKRVKISGCIQTQYQQADAGGKTTFAGGHFASKNDSRLIIRRGRVKINYSVKTVLFSMQMNGSKRCFNLIDIYAGNTETYLKSFLFKQECLTVLSDIKFRICKLNTNGLTQYPRLG